MWQSPKAAKFDGEGAGVAGRSKQREEPMQTRAGVQMGHAALAAALSTQAAAALRVSPSLSSLRTPSPPLPMPGGAPLPAMGSSQGPCVPGAASTATNLAGQSEAMTYPPPVAPWPWPAADQGGTAPAVSAAPPHAFGTEAAPFLASPRFGMPGAPPLSTFCNLSSASDWSDDEDVDDDDEEEAQPPIGTNTDLDDSLLLLMWARRRQIEGVLAASYWWASFAGRRRPRWGGSVPGRRVVHRDNAEGEASVMCDYFVSNPIFNETTFRRRFRMRQNLFIRIADAVIAFNNYFVQKYNAALKKGLHPYQKITAALRMLAYGGPADCIDEYLRIAKSTVWEATRKFAYVIVKVFGDTYLRPPTPDDTARLLEMHASRGFPSMIGSLDCMHWKWRSCPPANKGVYSGRSKAPTLILEAVASYDGWIWHSFFGTAGSNNDINVLQRSHLFHRVIRGEAPPVHFSINGHEYDMGYYLVDGIYPELSTFVKKIAIPITPKEKNFTQAQESCRKDIERAFGMLQARWSITCQPARAWDTKTLKILMKAAIIMHNMIIEDEGGLQAGAPDFEMMDTSPEPVHAATPELLEARRRVCDTIEDESLHTQLRDDLVKHLWQIRMVEMM